MYSPQSPHTVLSDTAQGLIDKLLLRFKLLELQLDPILSTFYINCAFQITLETIFGTEVPMFWHGKVR